MKLGTWIKIDEISTTYEDKFVHFLTRPQILPFRGPTKWNSSLYTSELIFKIISHQKPAFESINKLRFLKPSKKFFIQSPNKKKRILVCLLPTKSASGNVMLIFEDLDNKQILYTGEFTEYQSVLENPIVLQSSIHTLFKDNTCESLYQNSCQKSIKVAALCVQKLMLKYPTSQFVICLPEFGYEDLLLHLSTTCNIQIGVNTNRYLLLSLQNKLNENIVPNTGETKMLVITSHIEIKQIKRAFLYDQRIFIKFIFRDINENVVFHEDDKKGLCQIIYAPNPSKYDIHQIIKNIKPKTIRSIYKEFNTEISSIPINNIAMEID